MTEDRALVHRYVHALAAADREALGALYAEDVVFYTPFAWGARGRPFIEAFVEEFHRAHPGARIDLHDVFASADGTSVCARLVLHWHNTGPFFGHPATGARGTSGETHILRLDAGRIVEQWVSHNTHQLTHLEMVTWGMAPPEDTPDPVPAELSVTSAVPVPQTS